MRNSAHEVITVYRPNQRHELGWLHTWVVMGGNIIRSRELIWQLFKRDFTAGYKKSFFGLATIFFSPFIGILSWVFLNKVGVLQPGDVGVPYPAYVLIGSSMWGLFMGFYSAASGTLSAGGGFILQVNYPHEALLFKQVAQHLAYFSLSFVSNIVIMIFYGIKPGWGALWLPLVALPLFFLGSGIGLLFSMINVVAVDVTRVAGVVFGLLIYATPILYSDKIPSPWLQAVVRWNPLTYLICSARDTLLFGRLYEPKLFLLCAAGSVVLFMLSWRLFFVSENKVIERMI